MSRRSGLGAISLPGVKLTTSRGDATLDKVGVAGYYLQVCATGSQAIVVEPDQFTLTSVDSDQTMPQLASGGYAPPLKAGSATAQGCAEGYLSFDLSEAQSDAYVLTWQGSAGKAVWSFNG